MATGTREEERRGYGGLESLALLFLSIPGGLEHKPQCLKLVAGHKPEARVDGGRDTKDKWKKAIKSRATMTNWKFKI